MNSENAREIEERLAALVSAGKLRKKSIVVFGAADSAIVADKYLQTVGLKISAVINNDSALHGAFLKELSLCISSPGDLFAKGVKRFAVLIASRHYVEMMRQLSELGFTENKNMFQIADYKFSHSADLSYKEFLYHLRRVVKGRCLKRKLLKQAGLNKDGTLYVLGYCALGDAYLVSSLLHNGLNQGASQKWALVIQNKQAIKEIAGFFNIPRVVSASYDERMLLLAYSQFFGEAANIEFVCLSKNRVNDIGMCLGVRSLNFADMYKQAFLPNGEFSPPTRRTTVQENIPGISPGNTVIFFPYAYTVPLLDRNIWDILATELKALGYVVLTNTAGSEQPISGTTPVSIPIGALIDTVELAGGVIMNRSGICDVISSAKCKKAVFYPPLQKYNGARLIDVFGLKNMGLCSDALELQLEEGMGARQIAALVLDCFLGE